ncbi:MAG TPA: VWA domain-containing protein [Gammaproteobacteria bacterium]|nr:VWA domain-containing protein [Gammaproteobacteria bacterium]
MSDHSKKTPAAPGTSGEVARFLEQMNRLPATGSRRGRLIFAMDATASRQPSWDRAAHVQAQMFDETAKLGGLDVQLAYFRGYGEFHATSWRSDPRALLQAMTAVHCASGLTQIERVIKHTLAEHRHRAVNALVYVGDFVEEDIETLTRRAGELGVHGVPAFLFHEGDDPLTAHAFQSIARLSGGAYSRFNADSPQQLRELLGAVAVYASGGLKALDDYARRHAQLAPLLTHQLKR